jgi:hypothetical protein
MTAKRERSPSKIDIQMPVRVSFQIDDDPELATGWIARLSLAGVDIETLHPSPVGSRIVFHAVLDPEGTEILTYQGRIQWVVGGRVGVQFMALGARETHAILQAMHP